MLLTREGCLASLSPAVVDISSPLGRTTGGLLQILLSKQEYFWAIFAHAVMKKGSAMGPDDREEPEDQVPRSGHWSLLLTALDVAPCLHNRSLTL